MPTARWRYDHSQSLFRYQFNLKAHLIVSLFDFMTFPGESDICPRDLDSGSLLNFDLNNTSVSFIDAILHFSCFSNQYIFSLQVRFTTNNLYRISVALFPPHPEILSELCRQGFQDTLRFLALRSEHSRFFAHLICETQDQTVFRSYILYPMRCCQVFCHRANGQTRFHRNSGFFPGF